MSLKKTLIFWSLEDALPLKSLAHNFHQVDRLVPWKLLGLQRCNEEEQIKIFSTSNTDYLYLFLKPIIDVA